MISLCFLRIKAQSYGGECVWYIHGTCNGNPCHTPKQNLCRGCCLRIVRFWFGFLFSKTKTKDANCVVYGWHDERKVHHTIPFPFTSTHTLLLLLFCGLCFSFTTQKGQNNCVPLLCCHLFCVLVLIYLFYLFLCFHFAFLFKKDKKKKKQYKK